MALPRSMIVISMFLEMVGGARHARELATVAGIPSRWVYSFLRYWIRLGLVRVRRGLYGNLYEFQPTAKAFIRDLLRILGEVRGGDPVLREILRRLRAKGLRRPIYADVIRALYIIIRDKEDTTPYIRYETAEPLARLLLEVLEHKYTPEEILEALEDLNQAGVIIYNKPGKYPGYSVAFRPAFVRGLGIPAPPPGPQRKRTRRRP